MTTEHQAYDRLLRLANDAGRMGRTVYGYAVIPPTTAAGTYTVLLDARPMDRATESQEA